MGCRTRGYTCRHEVCGHIPRRKYSVGELGDLAHGADRIDIRFSRGPAGHDPENEGEHHCNDTHPPVYVENMCLKVDTVNSHQHKTNEKPGHGGLHFFDGIGFHAARS